MYYATGLPGWARWGYASPAQPVPPTPPPPAYAASDPESEMRMLREHAEWLSAQLEVINARLGELEKAGPASSDKGKS